MSHNEILFGLDNTGALYKLINKTTYPHQHTIGVYEWKKVDIRKEK